MSYPGSQRAIAAQMVEALVADYLAKTKAVAATGQSARYGFKDENGIAQLFNDPNYAALAYRQYASPQGETYGQPYAVEYSRPTVWNQDNPLREPIPYEFDAYEADLRRQYDPRRNPYPGLYSASGVPESSQWPRPQPGPMPF